MWVEWEDGAELSRSDKKPGSSSPLTRDADGQLGQVTLDEIDELDEAAGDRPAESPAERSFASQLVSEVVAEVLSQLVQLALDEATPHVKRWWTDRGRPAVVSSKKSVRKRLSRIRRADPLDPSVEVAVAASAGTKDHSVELETVVERRTMRSDEARERLLAAMLARTISDELVRSVSEADVKDLGQLGARRLIEELDPAQFEVQLELILEANPSFLDEFTHRFLGGRGMELVALTEGDDPHGDHPDGSET